MVISPNWDWIVARNLLNLMRRSVDSRPALPSSFLAAVFLLASDPPDSQESSRTKVLATLKSFALGGKGDGLDGRSGWSNGGA